jgi:hypothetical protein
MAEVEAHFRADEAARTGDEGKRGRHGLLSVRIAVILSEAKNPCIGLLPGTAEVLHSE